MSKGSRSWQQNYQWHNRKSYAKKHKKDIKYCYRSCRWHDSKQWRDTSQAGQLGHSVNLTHIIFCVRVLQCREEMPCPRNHLLPRSIRTLISISIYEGTYSRGGRLKVMGSSQTVLFYISYTCFSITTSNYYQSCLQKLPQVFIDAYTGCVVSECVFTEEFIASKTHCYYL